MWTVIDVRTGQVETTSADRIEDDGNGWSWWLVVVIVNTPRWSCVRRLATADLLGMPREVGPH
ncbi:MAG: hypothetical protein M3400_07250 [Actinomycetota bacterium]|nr:hypothetical protein [Actinomycetota bacterium]